MHIPGWISETTATFYNLKHAGMAIPTTSSFILPIQPVQKTDESWRITEVQDKLDQVVTPIPATVLDVIALLEKINAPPGTCYVAIDL